MIKKCALSFEAMMDGNRVWLIDDQEMANYLTANFLEINNFSSEIRTFTSAREALEELSDSVGGEGFPDFIFLDLNIPDVDGWAFLDAYRKFPKEVKESCTLYILSSSVDEEEINRSKLYEDVRNFLTKPLNKMDLKVINFQEWQSILRSCLSF